MKDVNDILQERGKVVKQMQDMLNAAETEGRDLTAEESAKFDELDKTQDSLKQQADRIHKAQLADKELEDFYHNSPVRIIPDNAAGGDDERGPYANKAYGNAFDKYARVGKAALDGGYLNALQVGTDSEGGYIVPEEFETQLVEALQDINEVRVWANVISTAGDRNIPVESTLGTAAWTAEEAAYSESDAAFGQVVLNAYKLTTIIKVSEELLQDAFFDLQGYLARNFGKRFGLAEETAFVNGSGSGQPTGMIDGSQAGVTAAGAAAITADELIELYHSLKRPYRKNAVFIMKDSTVELIRKLKDGDSQYLWQPGLQAGQPDRLLGRPLISSDGMEAATTGLKSVLFCDPSYYTIADRSNMVLQRLNELYAANGQVGFRMFKRTDGKVTLAEAFKHLVQA